MADSYNHDLFDVDYFQRRRWISEAEIPNTCNAAGATMKAVLHAIHDHYGKNEKSWPSEERIASQLSVTTRTVERAIRGLKELSLLIAIPTGYGRGKGVHNQYVIVWGEVTLREPSRREAHRDLLAGHRAGDEAKSAPIHSDTPPIHSDMVAIHSDILSLHSDTMSDELIIKQIKEPPPPPAKTKTLQQPTPRSADWKEVEEVLVSLPQDRRPGAWKSALETARQSGVTPDHVLAILRFYESEPSAFGPGALYHRLRYCHPRIAPAEGWTKPTVASVTSSSNAKVAEIQRLVARVEFTVCKSRQPTDTDATIRAKIESELKRLNISPEHSEWCRVAMSHS